MPVSVRKQRRSRTATVLAQTFECGVSDGLTSRHIPTTDDEQWQAQTQFERPSYSRLYRDVMATINRRSVRTGYAC
jgi:hypothetical protein